MDTRRDGSFDRKLEQLVVARLRSGQTAESLLAELNTRLEPAEAEAILSRAEARAAGATTRLDPAARVLTWLALAWTAILVLQNIGVALSATQSMDAASAYDRQTVFIPFLAFAVANIVLLCAGVVASHRWRNLLAACAYAVAILFAFPLTPILQSRLLSSDDGLGVLTTVSALGSYAAALCVVAAQLRTRSLARPPIAVEAFD